MKIMKSLFKMLNISDKYIEINETIENYASIHLSIAKSIQKYEIEVEKIAKENEKAITKNSLNHEFQTKEFKKLYNNIEALMLTGIKEKYLEMQEFGLVLDNIMDSFSKRDGEEKVFSVFGHKLSKSSIIEFNESMLKDENVSIVEFPELLVDDSKKYANKMMLILEDINNAKDNINHCEKILSELDQNDPVYSVFKQMKEINISNLSTFELDFLKEVKKTKNILDKTLNFIQPPHEFKKETVVVHAYLRKLVDVQIFKSEFFYKRFTNELPECLQPFKDDLGFFIIKEERAKNEKNDKNDVAA